MSRVSSLLMAALPPAIWGSTYLVTSEFLPADRPLTAAVMRILPVGLVLVLFSRHWPRSNQWLKLTALSLLRMSLLHWPLFVSAYRLPGGLAALLTAYSGCAGLRPVSPAHLAQGDGGRDAGFCWSGTGADFTHSA